MTRKTILAVLFWGLCTDRPASAEIIHVPMDYPTIQSAVNAASSGDEIIVAPGTYNELISTLGKSIVLRSSGGSNVTAIDGDNLGGTVLTFSGNQGPPARLEGFTVSSHGPHIGLRTD